MELDKAHEIATCRDGKIGKIAPPDHAWLAKQTKEPALEPALPIIDTHHHIWDRPGNHYFIDDLLADAGGGHNIVATVTSECAAMYRTTGKEEFKPVGETEAIVRTVEARGKNEKTKVGAGIVGFANLTLGEKVEPVLQAHIEAGKGRFRGIRYTTTYDASSEIPNRNVPGVLGRKDFRAGLSNMAPLGLVFDAWVFHPQLGELTELARAFPSTTIVCCHTGGQLGYGPYAGKNEEVFAAWKASMAELASCPNVFIKLGGLVMRLAAYDYTTIPVPPSSAELARLWKKPISICIELFGADRCMFQSNFPVDKMGTGYTVLWNAFKRITAGASASEKAALYSETAKKVYRLS